MNADGTKKEKEEDLSHLTPQVCFIFFFKFFGQIKNGLMKLTNRNVRSASGSDEWRIMRASDSEYAISMKHLKNLAE